MSKFIPKEKAKILIQAAIEGGQDPNAFVKEMVRNGYQFEGLNLTAKDLDTEVFRKSDTIPTKIIKTGKTAFKNIPKSAVGLAKGAVQAVAKAGEIVGKSIPLGVETVINEVKKVAKNIIGKDTTPEQEKTQELDQRRAEIEQGLAEVPLIAPVLRGFEKITEDTEAGQKFLERINEIRKAKGLDELEVVDGKIQIPRTELLDTAAEITRTFGDDYGSVDRVAKTFAEDPVKVLADYTLARGTLKSIKSGVKNAPENVVRKLEETTNNIKSVVGESGRLAEVLDNVVETTGNTIRSATERGTQIAKNVSETTKKIAKAPVKAVSLIGKPLTIFGKEVAKAFGVTKETRGDSIRQIIGSKAYKDINIKAKKLGYEDAFDFITKNKIDIFNPELSLSEVRKTFEKNYKKLENLKGFKDTKILVSEISGLNEVLTDLNKKLANRPNLKAKFADILEKKGRKKTFNNVELTGSDLVRIRRLIDELSPSHTAAGSVKKNVKAKEYGAVRENINEKLQSINKSRAKIDTQISVYRNLIDGLENAISSLGTEKSMTIGQLLSGSPGAIPATLFAIIGASALSPIAGAIAVLIGYSMMSDPKLRVRLAKTASKIQKGGIKPELAKKFQDRVKKAGIPESKIKDTTKMLALINLNRDMSRTLKLESDEDYITLMFTLYLMEQETKGEAKEIISDMLDELVKNYSEKK